MGGIVDNIKNKFLYTAQYNLLYIVSYFFTQENYNNSNTNPFIMCQAKEEEKNKKITTAWILTPTQAKSSACPIRKVGKS